MLNARRGVRGGRRTMTGSKHDYLHFATNNSKRNGVYLHRTFFFISFLPGSRQVETLPVRKTSHKFRRKLMRSGDVGC